MQKTQNNLLSSIKQYRNQNDNSRGGAGLNIKTGTDAQAAGQNGLERFDTLLNSIFSSTYQRECSQLPAMNMCSHKELPCFFEFLHSCTVNREEDLVYGLYCLRHTNATNRTFAAIGTQTTVDMQPIYLKTATCEPNMFLWSFLTNVTYPRAKELISFMNIGTQESSSLAKFIMAVSEPVGSRNGEEFQRLHQYLAAYCQSAIKCIETIPDRDKILIPINLSTSFLADNISNSLVADIVDKASNKELSMQTVTNDVTQFFVPLSMLNILDQINLLSFRMYCGIGRISLAPNVSVTGDRIFIGSGLSIRNALSSVQISKLRSYYPDNIYRIIRNVHTDSVHQNYDILVMLAVPANINIAINPQIFLAQRKYVSPTFDVEKLDILTFC